MRKYDREFKIEAVRMASEPGVTAKEVERRLGIGTGVSPDGKGNLKTMDSRLSLVSGTRGIIQDPTGTHCLVAQF